MQGAWIEIGKVLTKISGCDSRSPCRERGLKSLPSAPIRTARPSLPVQGAWIEIIAYYLCGSEANVAPRAGSVD